MPRRDDTFGRMSSSSCKQSHRAVWRRAQLALGYLCVASSLDSGPSPSPEAGLGLIPAPAWGSPSQPTGQVWAPHASIQDSKAQPSGHTLASHYQPSGRGQGRAGLADRRMAHFILPVLPGHLPAMSGPLGLTFAPNSLTKKLPLATSENHGSQKRNVWDK